MVASIVPLIHLFVVLPLSFTSPETGAASACTVPAHVAETTVAQNFRVAVERLNHHDEEGFAAQLDDDVEMYTFAGWARGKSSVRQQFATAFRQAPQLRVEITELNTHAVERGVVLVSYRWNVYPAAQASKQEGVGSAVYVCRNDVWRAVQEHETVTRVNPAPAAVAHRPAAKKGQKLRGKIAPKTHARAAQECRTAVPRCAA